LKINFLRLYVFRNIESYKILACGGDGTIGWVLSCLDNVSQDAKCQSPPMAIVPLGTGNDLARVLRWGAGYTGAEEPINLLRDVIDAEEILLDRWTVVFHSDENKELEEAKKQMNQANTNEDNTEIYVMNNYIGIGIDAEVALDFHTAREENPNKFNSRLQNKKYYFQMGLRKMMNKSSCKDLNRLVSLEVDGRRIDMPQIEGIIILNIQSWGGGSNPWGSEKDDQFQKSTHYDGMLEVVGIKGVLHMGQISGGLSGAIRVAQGGRVLKLFIY
jgi:diacylglycerol kinase (ATP)